MLLSLLLLPVGLVLALVLGPMLGAVPGLLIGWMVAPVLGAKPFWLVRRTVDPEALAATGELVYKVTPLTHSGLVAAPTEANPQPGIFLGTSWFNIVEARPVRRWFTSKLNGVQKIQLGALCAGAVSMAVVVILLLIMTQRP
jgi:hypothetical protein